MTQLFRHSQGGNATIITALSMLLMLVLIFVAVGNGETASGSTDMQAVSDEAALTAGAAQVGLLNDKTVIDLLQWTFQTVSTIGTDIEIAGGIARTLGGLGLLAGGSGALLIEIGNILSRVGSEIRKIGQKLKQEFQKIVGKVEPFIAKAKLILSMANSTIIAGNNGYFGFAIPATLTLPGPTTMGRDEVDAFINNSRKIADGDNYAGVFAVKEKRADALRYRALHQIWSIRLAATDPPTAARGSGGKVLVYPRAHPGKFYISRDAWPAGCEPYNAMAGETNTLLLPDTNIFPGEDPQPDPTKCNDISELFTLMRQPFNAEINMLRTLREKLAAQGTFDDGSPTSDMYGPINDAINELTKQVREGNRDWFNQNVRDKYDKEGETIDCPLPSLLGSIIGLATALPRPPVKKITFYDRTKSGEDQYANFTDCDGPVPGFPPGATYFWEGAYRQSDYQLPEKPKDGIHHDYRNTQDALDQEDASGLDDWLADNAMPNGGSHAASAGANDATVFLMFKDVQSNLGTDLVTGLTGSDPRPSKWAIAASVVQVAQGPPGSGDNVSFTQLCGTLFGEDADQGGGLFGLPANARQWCTTIANLIVNGGADLFNALPGFAKDLLAKLIEKPPNSSAFHAQLVDLCPVPGLSDLTKVLDSLNKDRHDRAALFADAYRAVWTVVQRYKRDFGNNEALVDFLPKPEQPPSTDCPPNLKWNVHLPSKNPPPVAPPGLKFEPPAAKRGTSETAVPTGTWPADTNCTITVTSSRGNKSEAKGLTPHKSSAKGALAAWKWFIGTRLDAPSTEDVVVKCGAGSAVQAQLPVVVA